jgi:hypothetical protein
MNNPSDVRLTGESKRKWFNIGAIFVVLLMGLIFFFLAASRLKNETHETAPPAHDATQPGSIVPH